MKRATLFPPKSAHDARHSRLAVGIFAALFIVCLFAGYAVYRQLVESDERRTEQTLNHLADIQAAAISAWMEERLGDAAVFSSGRFLGETMHAWIARGAPNDDTKRQILEQLHAIKMTYSYLDVCIYDINGKPLISTEEENVDTPHDPLEEQTVKRAVAANATQISPLHAATAAPGEKRVVHIATPLLNIHERSGKMPSILLMTADADQLLDSFARPTQLMTGSTEILLAELRNGQVMKAATGQKSASYGDLDALPITPEKLMAVSAWTNGSFLLMSPSRPTMVSVARKISGSPWYLITMIDRNTTRSNVRRLAWLVAGGSVGLLTLLGTALLLWWKERESELRLQTLRATTEKELLQRQYDFLSKYANDMIVLTDRDGKIIEVNDKTSQVLGHSRSDLIGAPFEALSSSSCKPVLDEALNKLRTQGIAVFEITKLTKDGTPLPVEISARAIELEGKHFIQMIGRDITERRQSETALRESQNRLNGILASILDVVWSFSPDLSRLHYINQSVERIYGYTIAAFLENPRLWFDAIHPEDRTRIYELFTSLNAEHPLHNAEYRIVRRDREVRWLHCKGMLVVDEHGQPLRIDGVATDITERKNAEQQVQLLAYYDSVTMLPNRRLLHDRLVQAMHMAVRSEKKVALLYMDLDNFKNVNDSLGHHIGDMLLREIAERLLQCVRDEDTVARIGGDEFLVVLPDIEKGAQAVAVAEKILAATARPMVLQGNQVHTTISIGISICPEDAREPHELMQHADSALYQAKGQGRDNYQFFTPELNHQIMRGSSIERQLREALDGGDLSLWYQPQVDIGKGKLIGAEALLRCRRKSGDFLSPVEFIPVAEERGLIGRIGEWALREACMQCRRWQRQGLHIVPIAVNVSPIQFQQNGFAGLVTRILADAELEARYLELEITESSIMRRAPQVAQLAMRLRDAGVGISIDDFGTGYSSLSYLKQIPIDKIKIDRSFIDDMLNDDDDDAITYAIINLAHSLNLRVIAEGVESKAQIDRLRMYGCDEVQGYYYSSAVSAQVFEQLLADEKAFAN